MKMVNTDGYFGIFGGQHVDQNLMPLLKELEQAYAMVKKEKTFWETFYYYLKNYAGRPTPLYFAKNLTEKIGGAKIYLKREDLLHGGAHKINNTIGQALLAKRMGKTKLIAETGAGQHGVATAMAGALLGMDVEIYMGVEDVERQKMNVYRMELLGAKAISVNKGQKSLKEAMDEALKEWVQNKDTVHYLIGSTVGPHPFPTIVRDFQAVIGIETKKQILAIEEKLPNAIIACVGGGSNAMGLFYPFITNKEVDIIGVEAGGKGIDTGQHAATMTAGKIEIIHGANTYVLKDDNGNIMKTQSIAPGLVYPGIGPELAFLGEVGRAKFITVCDDVAVSAFKLTAKTEGILPALESAHAIAHAIEIAKEMDKDDIIIVNVSGRGDKDIETVKKHCVNK